MSEDKAYLTIKRFVLCPDMNDSRECAMFIGTMQQKPPNLCLKALSFRLEWLQCWRSTVVCNTLPVEKLENLMVLTQSMGWESIQRGCSAVIFSRSIYRWAIKRFCISWPYPYLSLHLKYIGSAEFLVSGNAFFSGRIWLRRWTWY